MSVNSEEDSASVPQTKRKTVIISPIICGEVNSATGEREFVKFFPFFNKSVELFFAQTDDSKMPLFRTALLAKHLGCNSSRIGMWLNRRRDSCDGIYQASTYLNRPSSGTGLKIGAYFISLEVCQEIQNLVQKNDERKKLKLDSAKKQQMLKNPPSAAMVTQATPLQFATTSAGTPAIIIQPQQPSVQAAQVVPQLSVLPQGTLSGLAGMGTTFSIPPVMTADAIQNLALILQSASNSSSQVGASGQPQSQQQQPQPQFVFQNQQQAQMLLPMTVNPGTGSLQTMMSTSATVSPTNSTATGASAANPGSSIIFLPFQVQSNAVPSGENSSTVPNGIFFHI